MNTIEPGNGMKSAIAFAVVLAIVLIGLLSSCSPAYHLKKAIEKGAEVKGDTVFTDVITERTITDTITHFQTVRQLLAGDTVVINTTRWRLKERIDTVTKTRYVQVECKPDTIKVATAVDLDISAGYTRWQLIGTALGTLLFALLVGYGIYRFAGIVRKSA